MECMFCKKQDATHKVKPKIYAGTATYVIPKAKGIKDEDYYNYFCNTECAEKWWTDLTWHLDTLDERMNANVHFSRTNGLKGTYKGIPVDASWNTLDAKYFGIKDYEFKNRRPHLETCKGCCLQ
jgi:hypothetical protein